MTLDILSELQPIGMLYQAGDYTAALSDLEKLWGQLPDKKEDTPNSYLMVSYGVGISLKAEKLDEAWQWASRGLRYGGNFNLAGESDFLAGEVAFARSDFEVAADHFNKARRLSGWRLFREKDPKYRRLIET